MFRMLEQVITKESELRLKRKLNALDSLLGDGFYFDDVDDEKVRRQHF